MNFEAAALAYIRYVMDDKRMSAGALAKAAGISASTLTRALNDPKHKFTLSMKTIEKIATFSKINPAPFLEAKDSAELTTGFFHRPDAVPDEDEMLKRYAVKNTLIVGEVAAGKWREPSIVHYFDYGPLSLTSTFHKPKDCFACIVRGDSASMIAQDGDILFCARINQERISAIRTHADSATGPVIVERRSKDAFKIELSARFIRPRKNGWILISACHDDHFGNKKRPYFQTVEIDDYLGNEELSIIGTVEWVIRGDTTDAINWAMYEFRE